MALRRSSHNGQCARALGFQLTAGFVLKLEGVGFFWLDRLGGRFLHVKNFEQTEKNKASYIYIYTLDIQIM